MISSGLILMAGCLLAGVADGTPAENQFVLDHGSESLALNADGALQRWKGRTAEKGTNLSSSAGEIRYAGKVLKLVGPTVVARGQDGFSFTYHWPEEPKIEVIIQHRLTRQGGLGLGHANCR